MDSFVDRVNSYFLPKAKDNYLQGVVYESLSKGKSITTRCSTQPFSYHPSSSIIQQGGMTETNYYHSNEADGRSWVEIQFNQEWVIPTTIVMADSGNIYRIRNWNFEASQNGVDYDILDVHTNDMIYQKAWQVESFPIKTRRMKPYRFFRVQQTGQMSGGTYALRVGRLEVFGITAFCSSTCTLAPRFPRLHTCFYKRAFLINLLCVIPIML